ncbi:alpha/beta hydrolase [bacterium]|nr:alpha/beta hydrolase [bacterium]
MFINGIAAAQPAVQMQETESYSELERRLLEHYGVEAESVFVEIANPALRVHLLLAGDGEPVLFLHGGDGEAADWAPLMAELQDDVQLIGIDRPGFGLTDQFDYSSVELRRHAGDFVCSLLDALGLEHATLMAGSMGGFFALATALDHPQRVDRLVLVGMPVGLFSECRPELAELCGTPGAPEAFMAGIATMEGLRAQYRGMFSIDPDSLPELYFRLRLAALQLPGTQDAWATLLTRIADLNGFRPELYLGAELPSLRQPVLLVWGEHDMAPAAVARQAVQAIPDCRFELLEGSGHLPFLTDPDRTAELVREFLLEHPLS